jgi:hypothetical protein
VLDTLIEKTSRKYSKNGGDGGTGIYMRKGTTSRVMAADRPYGEFYDLYSVSPENFGYHHVCHRTLCVISRLGYLLTELFMNFSLFCWQFLDHRTAILTSFIPAVMPCAGIFV